MREADGAGRALVAARALRAALVGARGARRRRRASRSGSAIRPARVCSSSTPTTSGMSHSVNRATFEALEKGWITSASILVPCPWFPEVAQLGARIPRPTSASTSPSTASGPPPLGPARPPDAVPSLLDADGYLPLAGDGGGGARAAARRWSASCARRSSAPARPASASPTSTPTWPRSSARRRSSRSTAGWAPTTPAPAPRAAGRARAAPSRRGRSGRARMRPGGPRGLDHPRGRPPPAGRRPTRRCWRRCRPASTS